MGASRSLSSQATAAVGVEAAVGGGGRGVGFVPGWAKAASSHGGARRSGAG
jgi:hypothetical protein